jgi:hypothetical protein
MAPIFNMAFFFTSFSRSSRIRQKLQNAKVFAYSLRINSKKKNLLPKNKFKMAAKFKMARSSFKKKKKIRAVSVALIPKFFRKKIFSKIQDGGLIQHEDYFAKQIQKKKKNC